MEGWVNLGLVDAAGDWTRTVWLWGQSINHYTTAPAVVMAEHLSVFHTFHQIFNSYCGTIKLRDSFTYWMGSW